MENIKKRVLYLDILRIAACFAVAFIHVANQNMAKVNVDTFEFNVFNIYNSLVRWAVPIFVMISGAIFLSRDYSIKDIYKKYLPRIVAAFIVWSIVYAIYGIIIGNVHNTKDFISQFVKGKYHLWYLYMIAGLYIIIPFLKKIAEDEKLLKYFIVLAFIFSIILPTIVNITSIYHVRLGKILSYVSEKAHFGFFTEFILYFMTGYYLSKKEKLKKSSTIIVYALGILSIIATGIFTTILSKHDNTVNKLFYQEYSINVFFTTIFIFTLFKNMFINKNIKDKVQNGIINISKCTFGIYLVHALILDILKFSFKINTLTFNPIYSVPAISIIVFTISLIISMLLNKIKYINKYIV